MRKYFTQFAQFTQFTLTHVLYDISRDWAGRGACSQSTFPRLGGWFDGSENW